MITLLAFLAGGGLEYLLLKIAIAVIVIWAIYQLVMWAGIPIPRPVWIILGALAAILMVYWLFEAFEALK